MTQILDPVPFDDTKTVLCCYVNDSSRIQIARISNISNWYFERVVFPGQRLMFESHINGQLEIHSGSMASSILEDTVPCSRLRIDNVEDTVGDESLGSALDLESESSAALNAMQPVHG